jgi:hypothetical protein
VVHITPLFAWRCAAGAAKLTVDWYKIKNRSSSAQLDQSYLILAALDRASKRVAVEAKHPVQINDAQHKVIDFANAHH